MNYIDRRRLSGATIRGPCGCFGFHLRDPERLFSTARRPPINKGMAAEFPNTYRLRIVETPCAFDAIPNQALPNLLQLVTVSQRRNLSPGRMTGRASIEIPRL